MKFNEKVKYKIRQYGYGHKKVKSVSREIIKKVEEIDIYLEKKINNVGKKRK